MLNYAKLCDLSKWNGPCFPIGHPQAGAPDLSKPMAMDLELAKSKGIVGIIARLGSIDSVTSVCYTDGRLPEIVKAAQAAKLPIGYYWYCRPSKGGGVQVKFILQAMQDMKLPFDLDFWIDVEEPGADVNGPGSAPYQARDAIKYMAQELQKVYPGRVGIYTRQSLWDPYVAPDLAFWPTLKLWAARWNSSLTSPWSDGATKFREWTEWVMWQYSADGNQQAASYGFTTGTVNLDLSYFNGTVEQFKAAYPQPSTDPLGELKQRVTDFTARVDTLDKAVNILASDVNKLRDSLKGQLAEQAQRIDGLLQQVQAAKADLEARVGTVESKQDTTDFNLNNLVPRVADMEEWRNWKRNERGTGSDVG